MKALLTPGILLAAVAVLLQTGLIPLGPALVMFAFYCALIAGLLVTDDRLKMLSFTGSAAVGWEMKRRAGKKKVALELGGNGAVMVHSDADLAFAAERCVAGGFAYAGQSCIAVQRILVERSVCGKFTDLLLAGVSNLRLGDPLQDSTDVGPLIRESDAICQVVRDFHDDDVIHVRDGFEVAENL